MKQDNNRLNIDNNSQAHTLADELAHIAKNYDYYKNDFEFVNSLSKLLHEETDRESLINYVLHRQK